MLKSNTVALGPSAITSASSASSALAFGSASAASSTDTLAFGRSFSASNNSINQTVIDKFSEEGYSIDEIVITPLLLEQILTLIRARRQQELKEQTDQIVELEKKISMIKGFEDSKCKILKIPDNFSKFLKLENELRNLRVEFFNYNTNDIIKVLGKKRSRTDEPVEEIQRTKTRKTTE